MEKPVLILQFRPEKEVADDEYQAFLKYGELNLNDTKRIKGENGFGQINLEEYSAILVGGSPYSISDKDRKENQIKAEKDLIALMKEIKEKDFPYYGNCYGLGSISLACGGIVSKEKYGEEVGAVEITLNEEGLKDKLTKNIENPFLGFVGHKEACQITPPDATLLASSPTCPVQMIRFGQNVYATQFHAELDFNGLALRIDFYKNKGYFPPEDAEKLKEKWKNTQVSEPMKILKKFMDIYYRKNHI